MDDVDDQEFTADDFCLLDLQVEEFFNKKKTFFDDFNEEPAQEHMECLRTKPVALTPMPAPVLRGFTMNRTALSQIILQVRDAIAIAKNISNKDFIANAAALAKIVAIPPQSFDEFRSLDLDGFTTEKIYRFGPTFINAVDKYTVRIHIANETDHICELIFLLIQHGQLEMQSILKYQPMITNSRNITSNLMRLIEAKKSQSEIVRTLNYPTEDQFISDVEYLIQTGHQITKEHIATLCNAHDVDFDKLRNNIGNEENVILISDTFIRLSIAYFRVRDHINRLNVPYFDYDENMLKNKQNLRIE